MSIEFTLDGKQVTAEEGQSLPEVAAANGIYLPTLCYHPEQERVGTCRVCQVRFNGSIVAGCTVRLWDGASVEIDAPDLMAMRREVVEMLFAEGNHNCPSCEKSGRCGLQGVAYEVGVHNSEFPYRYPAREADHDSELIWLERDRCIMCHRCVEFVHDTETGRKIFSLHGRGGTARIEIDRELADKMTPDEVRTAMDTCPVGAILAKGVGYDEPIGQRRYDRVSVRDRVLHGGAE
jgi:[NiFe] hydrogenase diaphorase moiety small subunit